MNDACTREGRGITISIVDEARDEAKDDLNDVDDERGRHEFNATGEEVGVKGVGGDLSLL